MGLVGLKSTYFLIIVIASFIECFSPIRASAGRLREPWIAKPLWAVPSKLKISSSWTQVLAAKHIENVDGWLERSLPGSGGSLVTSDENGLFFLPEDAGDAAVTVDVI